MTAAYESLAVIQRTPAWIEARQNGIGASEAAAALGLSRWESRYGLWARKCGLTPPVEPSLPMLLGTFLEPFIADLYTAQTGESVRRVNRLLRSKEHPFLLASLDRRRADGRVVEMKWSARADGYGEPGTDEVPDEVLCQVVQQMAVTGAPVADVALLRGGNRLDVYTVARDPVAESVLIEMVADLWGHVESRTEPAMDGPVDAELAALSGRFPRDDGSEIEADEDTAEAVRALLDVRDAIATHEANGKALRVVIEDAMREATALVVPGIGRVTWKAPKDSLVTDWAKAAQHLRTSVNLTTWETARDLHTETKQGTRRFLPSREGGTDNG